MTYRSSGMSAGASGHGIDPESLGFAAVFLKNALRNS